MCWFVRCVVQLKKCQGDVAVAAPAPAVASEVPMSRVDRLKNLKTTLRYQSADILPRGDGGTGDTKAGVSAAVVAGVAAREAPKVTGGAATSLPRGPHPGPKLPLPNLQPGRPAVKNIFSIFAPHVLGRGAPQDEPPPEVRNTARYLFVILHRISKKVSPTLSIIT